MDTKAKDEPTLSLAGNGKQLEWLERKQLSEDLGTWKTSITYDGNDPRTARERERQMTTVRPDGTKVLVEMHPPAFSGQGLTFQEGKGFSPQPPGENNFFSITVIHPDGTAYRYPPDKDGRQDHMQMGKDNKTFLDAMNQINQFEQQRLKQRQTSSG